MPADGYLDYLELPAPDLPAAKAFYRELFGWTFTDYGPGYAEFDSAGRKGGFNSDLAVATGGGPLIILFAADLEAMEAKVKAAGASITAHHEFPGGRRFHLRDPGGNEIAIWTRT